VDRLGSGPRLVGRLGSVVRVRASFRVFAVSAAATDRRRGASVSCRTPSVYIVFHDEKQRVATQVTHIKFLLI